MLYPVLVPLLAVDLHALYEVTSAFVIEPVGYNTECVVTVDSNVDVVKPWRDNEEDWLRDYRVKTKLLPNKP